MREQEVNEFRKAKALSPSGPSLVPNFGMVPLKPSLSKDSLARKKPQVIVPSWVKKRQPSEESPPGTSDADAKKAKVEVMTPVNTMPSYTESSETSHSDILPAPDSKRMETPLTSLVSYGDSDNTSEDEGEEKQEAAK